jgi:hypothetical protein
LLALILRIFLDKCSSKWLHREAEACLQNLQDFLEVACHNEEEGEEDPRRRFLTIFSEDLEWRLEAQE